MSKHKDPSIMYELISFEDFIEYGKNNGGNIVNGMPWSFNFNGHPVTHENDECYLIPIPEGVLRFTPQDLLMTGENGDIYVCKDACKKPINKKY